MSDEIPYFDLQPHELENLSRTVEHYRLIAALEAQKNDGKVSETTRRKLSKAYKLLQEENFNRQFLK